MVLISHLPPDVVIVHIFPRLDYTARVRFAAVCHSWRDLSQTQMQLTPDMPWLWMVSSKRNYYRLLNLSLLSANPRPTAPIHGNTIGCNSPYVLIVDEKRHGHLKICNPFTGHIVPLPLIRVNNAQRFIMGSFFINQTSIQDCLAAVSIDDKLHMCRVGPGHEWVRVPTKNQLYVHRLDPDRRVLVKMDDLGDNLIFVSKSSSVSWSPQGLWTNKFFTQNCIYIISHQLEGRIFVGKYCLPKKKVVSCFSLCSYERGSEFDFKCTWITPNPL